MRKEDRKLDSRDVDAGGDPGEPEAGDPGDLFWSSREAEGGKSGRKDKCLRCTTPDSPGGGKDGNLK